MTAKIKILGQNAIINDDLEWSCENELLQRVLAEVRKEYSYQRRQAFNIFNTYKVKPSDTIDLNPPRNIALFAIQLAKTGELVSSETTAVENFYNNLSKLSGKSIDEILRMKGDELNELRKLIPPDKNILSDDFKLE